MPDMPPATPDASATPLAGLLDALGLTEEPYGLFYSDTAPSGGFSPDPGPAGFTGSVVLAEFDSLASAQTWAEADPYSAAGVYAKVTVKPFKNVFPA